MQSVHVALDALAFGNRPVGVGRYITTLARGLLEIEDGPRVLAITRWSARNLLASTGVNNSRNGTNGPGRALSSAPVRILWEQLVLDSMATAAGCNLIHGLMGSVPVSGSLPSVVTIHDATFFSHPELHVPSKNLYFRALLPLTANAARLVITDSAASQREIVAHLGVDEDRVRVVPLCPDEHFSPAEPDAIQQTRERYGIQGPFLLYAGVLEPRKNLPNLIAAVANLRQLGYPHRLVVIGKRGWGSAPIEQAIADAGELVLPLGFVIDDDLPPLLSACDAFTYVPVAEGFGLPVVEAMACGAPVITSSISSLPEAAGGAAELVDPHDVLDIQAGIQRVLDDAGRREKMAIRGRLRAAKLTASRLARETVEVYHDALGLLR